jgi:hypothetical protein
VDRLYALASREREPRALSRSEPGDGHPPPRRVQRPGNRRAGQCVPAGQDAADIGLHARSGPAARPVQRGDLGDACQPAAECRLPVCVRYRLVRLVQPLLRSAAHRKRAGEQRRADTIRVRGWACFTPAAVHQGESVRGGRDAVNRRHPEPWRHQLLSSQQRPSPHDALSRFQVLRVRHLRQRESLRDGNQGGSSAGSGFRRVRVSELRPWPGLVLQPHYRGIHNGSRSPHRHQSIPRSDGPDAHAHVGPDVPRQKNAALGRRGAGIRERDAGRAWLRRRASV